MSTGCPGLPPNVARANPTADYVACTSTPAAQIAHRDAFRVGESFRDEIGGLVAGKPLEREVHRPLAPLGTGDVKRFIPRIVGLGSAVEHVRSIVLRELDDGAGGAKRGRGPILRSR